MFIPSMIPRMKIIRQRNGTIRLVTDELEPGEGESLIASLPNDTASQLKAQGIQWGDVVAWTTQKMGIKACAPCKARQALLNHLAENGILETARLIKATLGISQ